MIDGSTRPWDAVVLGGSFAGLAAALTLGRARRRVLVLDAGEPRNAPAQASHGFLTRDGASPQEILRIAREQLAPYPTVSVVNARAERASREGALIVVEDARGERHAARRLLFAVGVRDELPPVEGLRERWGTTAFHCPYCHGYELRGERIAILAHGDAAVQMARLIQPWTRDVVVLADGGALAQAELAALAELRAEVQLARILRVAGAGARIDRIELADGTSVAARAIMLRPPTRVATPIVAALGCALAAQGHIQVGASQETSVPGVYAAGDCARPAGTVTYAAADGVNAAMAMNRSLLDEELPALRAS